MRSLRDLEKAPKTVPEVHDKAMEIMAYMFSRANENLTRPVPWGDEKQPSDRKPTMITDTGLLLTSGIPPYWEGDRRVAFRFDAAHAMDVEVGSPPTNVPASVLEPWVRRRLGKKGSQATGIAHAISRRIAKEGIPAHPYVRPAIEQARRKYGLSRTTSTR